MQFFGKLSRFTHFFLGSAQTVKIIPSSAFKFFRPLLEAVEGFWSETWGQAHPWCLGWCYLSLRKIPWKFCVDIFMGSMSGKGVKKGCTWRTLGVPDQRHRGQDHPWHLEWFCVDIIIRSVSGMWGQERWNLEDVESSWPETWRTGFSMTLWI